MRGAMDPVDVDRNSPAQKSIQRDHQYGLVGAGALTAATVLLYLVAPPPSSGLKNFPLIEPEYLPVKLEEKCPRDENLVKFYRQFYGDLKWILDRTEENETFGVYSVKGAPCTFVVFPDSESGHLSKDREQFCRVFTTNASRDGEVFYVKAAEIYPVK